jgi:glycyl-tRNA synthetase
MIDNKDSKKRYRTDQLLEDKIERYQKDGKAQKAADLQQAMDAALLDNNLEAMKQLIVYLLNILPIKLPLKFYYHL